MIAEIEQKILEVLSEKGLQAKGLAVRKKPSGRTSPEVSVSIENGDFQKVTLTKYRQTVYPFLIIEFKNLKSEAERKRGIAEILQGVIDYLLLQTLNINIDPLVPINFRNVTTTEEYSSKIVYQIKLKTGFIVSKIDDEPTIDLLTIGLNYYLQEPVDDDVADASDEVSV